MPIKDKDKENRDCWDFAVNKNKKFEKKILEILKFAEFLRNQEVKCAKLLIHFNLTLKKQKQI